MILAITSGEPAGIGPDLCAALPRREWAARLVVIGDRAMIAARIHAVEPALDIVDYAPDAARRSGALEVLHVPMVTKAVPGRLSLMASQVSDAFNTKTRVVPEAVWNGSFLPSAAELNILPKK